MPHTYLSQAFSIIATWRHIPLSTEEMALLIAVAYMNDMGAQALETLAWMTRTDVPTTQRLLQALTDKGCLTVTPEGHRIASGPRPPES